MAIKLLGLFLALAIFSAQGIDYHDTLDNEYDARLASVEELTGIMKCVCDIGPCTDLAASYRRHYPAVIVEACARCNAVQKRYLHIFMDRVMKDSPELLKLLKDLYDPKGKYWDKFYDAIKKF